MTVGSAVPTALGGLAAEADLVVFFLVGLLGGAHCLGMCGPLVTTYADRMTEGESGRRRRVTPHDVRQHGLFNLGRTLGYATVGAVLGLVGSLLFAGTDSLGAIADPVRAGVGILVGLLILGVGLGYLIGGTPTGPLARLPGLSRMTGLLLGPVDRLANSVGIVGLGTVHALLPCPILYPAYLYALAIGDPVRGALALGLLGLGTFPTLFAYGLAIGSIAVGHRRVLHRAMGVAFLALGYIPLAHGLGLLGVALPQPPIPIYQPLG